MKKWGIGFIIVLLACIPVFTNRGTGNDLLQDTDTKVLLQTIRARHQPLSWFKGDWPLQNHFYRPLPTLSFELDNALYKNNGSGYGVTNALLAIACVLLLYWFFREFTNNPVVSTLSSALFAFWVSGAFYRTGSMLVQYGSYLGLIAAIYWLFKKPIPWAKVRVSLIAFLTLYYASTEVFGEAVTPVSQLSERMIGWLPGRTASVMAVFALLAMAAYARYERISALRIEKEPSPLDPPATKSSIQTQAINAPWLWAILAIAATVLAFCSYEQAVMLPAALLGIAIAMRWQGFRSRWGWQVAFWLCLVGYMLLRKELHLTGTSAYQKQQLRFGPGVGLSLEGYAFPFFGAFSQIFGALASGLSILFMPDIYMAVLALAANVTAFVQARRRFIFAFTGWALSFLTFLPMAWVKPFEHYDFWPMALRSLFAITLCWVGIDLLVNAASPPELQAPVRLDPAPGSLPRP